MPALLQDTLPESLATRLTEEQRLSVFEAPRGLRLASLDAALGTDENATLLMAAGAAGIDVAANLETDPGARGLLPARLVHDFQIIPIRHGAAGGWRRARGADSQYAASPRLRVASRGVDGRLAPHVHAAAARVAPGRSRTRPPADHREFRRRLRRP